MMVDDAWIGIDPGAKGAACLISGEEIEFCTWNKDASKIIEVLYQWKLNYSIKLVFMEQVGARPGQGVTSMFSFGTNNGWWKGAMAVLTGEEPMTVTPQKWQAMMLDAEKGDVKMKSVRVANKLAGLGLKMTKNGVDNGKADAYHMARYAKKYFKEYM